MKILQFLSKTKEKKQDCLQFSIRYQISKIFSGYSAYKIHIDDLKKTTKKFTFLIAYRKLNAILFFFFCFRQKLQDFQLVFFF
jgi:hypothetical protein